MPYGGAPNDAILVKLEETDPRLLQTTSNPTGAMYQGRGAGFTEEAHKDFAIGAVLDRTPDRPWLAEHETRRDGQLSRSVLNLRYNGTRGSNSDLPRHPDMFLGFTGNDPRGADNTPRFDRMRRQVESRARQLEVRMGISVGHDGAPGEAAHQVAERPWTGPALQQARVRGHEWMRARTKVFDTSEWGRATGRNQVTDQMYGARSRRAQASGASTPWQDGDRGLARPRAPSPQPEQFAGHARPMRRIQAAATRERFQFRG